jgi:hypothetical protein
MGFAQVICLGLGLTMRLERLGSGREVVEVVRYLPAAQETPPPAAQGAPDEHNQAAKWPIAPDPELADLAEVAPAPPFEKPPLPPPPGLKTPTIQDPVVAKLVGEARQARVAEDMRIATIKLKEAEKLAADDPNVLYEFGMVYEVMGIYDLASSYYQRVYELGTTGAGTLYEEAARKISVGFAQPEDQIGRLSLGRTRIFKEDPPEGGQRVVITIPVYGAPGADFVADDLEVKVTFFEQDKDLEIGPIGGDHQPEPKWLTAPVDWAGQGEELLQISYVTPAPSVQDAHLFGARKYYGQVVELFYKGKLTDSQAWPRHLAQKMNTQEEVPMFLEDNNLPLDYNIQNPILPQRVR